MALTLYGPGITLTIDPDDDDTPVVVRSRCGQYAATPDYALKFSELLFVGDPFRSIYEDGDGISLSIKQENWIIDQQRVMEDLLYDGPVGPPDA